MLGAIAAAGGAAQSNRPFAADKMGTIIYGVPYYPEYMPGDRLEKDVEMMRKAGINVVRAGESTVEQLGAARRRFPVCLDGARIGPAPQGRHPSHTWHADVLHSDFARTGAPGHSGDA